LLILVSLRPLGASLLLKSLLEVGKNVLLGFVSIDADRLYEWAIFRTGINRQR